MSLIECPDCGERVLNLGLHFERDCSKWKKRDYGGVEDMLASEAVGRKRGRPPLGKKCVVCGRPVHAKGLCRNHYQQEWMRRKA